MWAMAAHTMYSYKKTTEEIVSAAKFKKNI